MNSELSSIIEKVWIEQELIAQPLYKEAIEEAIRLLDLGIIRCAEPTPDAPNGWQVNDWVKKAILLYFRCHTSQTISVGDFEYFDKIPLKKGFEALGVRVVPPATARYGSYLAPGVILMSSYVNIGGYVDSESMIDTWATVGSCAQIGKSVHISGGVGIGGVLEPPQAQPVIIEDGAFIGSRAVIVEGVRVGKEAVIGANVILTASTRIIDVSGIAPIEYKGMIPAHSVVIPGTFPKTFPAGTYNVPCALILGKRSQITNLKTSLNNALRDFQVPV